MGKVFLSYSHSDADTAGQITALLEEVEVPYFRDIKNIQWGDEITAEVKEGLSSSDAVIVILSPGSMKSHWVSYEVGFAAGRGIPVLPYLTHPDMDPPAFLHGRVYRTELRKIRDYFTDWNPGKKDSPSTEVQSERKKEIRLRDLSEKAQEILLAATSGNGNIAVFNHPDQKTVEVAMNTPNHRRFMPDSSRGQAEYVGAVEELEDEKLVVFEEGALWRVTPSGYQLSDKKK